MTMEKVWFPEEATIRIRQEGVSTVYTVTADVRNLKISGGERPMEQIKTFGGNEYSWSKPQQEFEVSFDIVKNDISWAGAFLGAGTTMFGNGTDGYFHIAGDGTRKKHHIQIEYSDGESDGERLRLSFFNAYAVTKEMSSDVDGYLQETISFKVLSSDYHEEYTSNASTDPLPTAMGIGTVSFS